MEAEQGGLAILSRKQMRCEEESAGFATPLLAPGDMVHSSHDSLMGP